MRDLLSPDDLAAHSARSPAGIGRRSRCERSSLLAGHYPTLVTVSTPHLCAEPGCPNVIDGPGRCAEHRRDFYPNTDNSLYRHGWRRIRDAYIADHPRCESCHVRAAAEVHHRDHDPRNNAATNLAALCASCHRKITAQYRKTKHAGIVLPSSLKP